jgi:hypothetical protein
MPLAARSHYENEIIGELTMPILLWLLGIPISIILLLMLFGVVSF